MANDNVDIISFATGGLNSDDDLLLLPLGDSRYRLNVNVSDDYNFNVLTNCRGNTLKNNSGTFSYPTGDLRVIGFVENKEEQAGIFFVYDSAGEHSIIQYYSETDTLEYVLDGSKAIVGSILNFNEDYFIDAKIIGNQSEKYLIWTDNYNEPRIINILYASNYSNGLLPQYIAISSELISFYKKPYISYLEVTGSSYSSSFSGNNIKGKVFDFSLRLKYYDKTFSPMSPYSNFIPTVLEIPSGRLSDEQADNRIAIEFDLQNELDLVDSYQLLFRNIDIGSGTPGNWYVYDTYSYTSKGVVTKYFYNEKSEGVIAESETLRYYDYVPQLADHVEVIDSNRVVLGGVTEGYPNVDYTDSDEWDVAFTPTANKEVEDAISGSEGVYQDSGFIDDGTSYSTSITFSLVDSESYDYYYYISITQASPLSTEGQAFESSFGLSQAEIFTLMETWVDGLSFDVDGSYSGSNFTVTLNPLSSSNVYYVSVVRLSETNTYNTLKTGATYKFGLVYSFDGRLGYVQTSDDLYLNTSNFGDITSTYTNYVLSTELEIDHIAPAGATGYHIVSFGSNIDYYEQYLVKCNFDDITDSGTYMTMYTDGINTIIRRDDMVNRFNAAYNDGISYGMDINVGDLIRFVGRFDNTPDSGTLKYDVELFDTNYEFVISYVDSTEIKCSYSAIVVLDTFLAGEIPIFIEIVRLKNQIDNRAQEFSRLYSIDSNGYHTGNDQDQTASVPAIINITEEFADCFKTKQVYINEHNYSDYGFGSSGGGFYSWMEKPRVSLYYDSYPTSWGRFNAVNENAATNTFNKIRWGGKFFDDTGYNFMSVFDYEDERILDDRNGEINCIQQIGDTLKVYQERKVNSFYLKTTSSTAADGSQTYVFSGDVMSEARQSVFDYGVTHFSSYVKSVRSAYYWDQINACVIKDTPGGPVVISDQKMHSYFKAKAKACFEYSGTVLVLGGYDEDLDMYLITFVDPDDDESTINETLGYYEPLERWISFYSYTPEWYGKISGDTALAFCSGKLYVQNANSTRNNFCGTQFSSAVDVHSNGNPNEIKVFGSMSVVSTGVWAPSGDGDVEITLPGLMQSRLLAGKFKEQEGLYHSEFLRDALVTDGVGVTTFERSQLHSGRALRGLEMRARLNNSDTGEANLRLVTVKSLISR